MFSLYKSGVRSNDGWLNVPYWIGVFFLLIYKYKIIEVKGFMKKYFNGSNPPEPIVIIIIYKYNILFTYHLGTLYECDGNEQKYKLNAELDE